MRRKGTTGREAGWTVERQAPPTLDTFVIVFGTTGTLNYRYYFKFGVSVRRRTVVGGARVVSGRPAGRSAGRSAGRPAGRPGGARVVSGAEKKII